MNIETSEQAIDRQLGIAVRQAFYEGVSRRCLNEAWQVLDKKRKSIEKARTFRGKYQKRKGLPLLEIANSLNRSTGEVSRWFQGQSPSWSNLMMAMLPLEADWTDLKNLPEKSERRFSGFQHALRLVKRRCYSAKNIGGPTVSDVQLLISLFEDAKWPAHRQSTKHRISAIQQQAKLLDVSAKRIDSVDSEWGNAFAILVHLYAELIGDDVWQ